MDATNFQNRNDNQESPSPAPQHATFVITTTWLHQHASRGGVGWTRAQLAVLGIAWPPVKGWLRGLHGRTITEAQRLEFERQGLKK